MRHGLRDHFFYSTFKPSCALNDTSTLAYAYGGCSTKTLGEAVADMYQLPAPSSSSSTATASSSLVKDNCTQTLTKTLYSGPETHGTNNAQLAAKLCAMPLGDFVMGTLCNPLATVGCPRTSADVLVFAGFVSCFFPLTNASWTSNETAAFWQSQYDQKCVSTIGFCNSTATSTWSWCPATMTDVFEWLDVTGTWQCSQYFRGAPGAHDRCQLSLKQLRLDVYGCPAPQAVAVTSAPAFSLGSSSASSPRLPMPMGINFRASDAVGVLASLAVSLLVLCS